MSGPSRLEFTTITHVGLPIRLTWPRPKHVVCGYAVLSTQNPFPPEMAPELFAGRMTDFIDEVSLGPEAAGLQVERAARYYAVIAMDGRGDWQQVDGLRESPLDGDAPAPPPLALASAMATQPRTLTRARWSPPTGANDSAVRIYVRDNEPDADALAAMLSGVIDADYVVPATADGFIDNVTPPDYRVYYVAIGVDLLGRLRPLTLTCGPFMRLATPTLLDPQRPERVTELMAAVHRQIDEAIRRRSSDRHEVERLLTRAADLSPQDDSLDQLIAAARARWPEFPETL